MGGYGLVQLWVKTGLTVDARGIIWQRNGEVANSVSEMRTNIALPQVQQ
jgi:hypothetical protein